MTKRIKLVVVLGLAFFLSGCNNQPVDKGMIDQVAIPDLEKKEIRTF